MFVISLVYFFVSAMALCVLGSFLDRALGMPNDDEDESRLGCPLCGDPNCDGSCDEELWSEALDTSESEEEAWDENDFDMDWDEDFEEDTGDEEEELCPFCKNPFELCTCEDEAYDADICDWQ